MASLVCHSCERPAPGFDQRQESRTRVAPLPRERNQFVERVGTSRVTLFAYPAGGVSDGAAAAGVSVPTHPSGASEKSPPWPCSAGGFACECAGTTSRPLQNQAWWDWMNREPRTGSPVSSACSTSAPRNTRPCTQQSQRAQLHPRRLTDPAPTTAEYAKAASPNDWCHTDARSR